MSESQWMSLVAGILVLAWLSPALFRMEQRELLRNIALWLTIFAVIGLGYRLFGPG